MITLTSTEAQNRFGEVLDTAQREPVTITRRGQPLAFIISPEELKKLFASQTDGARQRRRRLRSLLAGKSQIPPQTR